VRLYLSGPLFSEAERAWLDALAGRLRADGFDCFVPHEQLEEMTALSADEVYRADALRSSNALVAWLDGAAVDDGTACEIGMFAQLVAGDNPRYVGIVGIATDLRLERMRGVVAGDGLNLFLGGAVSAYGRLCGSVDEAIETLASWRTSGR
jgi:nucleoside 2-deoxyribosyltransferase